MSNYTKSTNFTSKDSLAVGNPLKIVKGTEIDAEFNNIATAVATKADLADPTFTGVPSAPTASAGTNTTQLATTAFTSTAVSNAITAYDTALTVSTAQIENDAVTADKIATGAVGNTELASDAVTQAKIADNAVGTAEIIDANITAAKLNGAQSGSAPIYGARAWVSFDGTKDSTGAASSANTNRFIKASGNVTSVTRNGLGDYTVNFSVAMQDANYGCSVSSNSQVNSSGYSYTSLYTNTVPTASSLRVSIPGVVIDTSQNSVVIFR